MTPEFWTSAIAAAAGTVAAMGVIGSGGLVLWKFGRGSIANDLAPTLGLHFRSKAECTQSHQADHQSQEAARTHLEAEVRVQVAAAIAPLAVRLDSLENRHTSQENAAEQGRRENREDFRQVFERLDTLADKIRQQGGR